MSETLKTEKDMAKEFTIFVFYLDIQAMEIDSKVILKMEKRMDKELFIILKEPSSQGIFKMIL